MRILSRLAGRRTALVLTTAALTLAGCGGDGGGTAGTAQSSAPGGTTSSVPGSATPTGGSGGEPLKVGLAYDIGGRGDQSFNDAAARGLDQAKSELGVTVEEAEASQGESNAAKEERLRQLAEAGFDPVIAVGFAYSQPLAAVAEENPDTRFAIIDDAAATGDNIANLVFAENEGSFLVGAAAALASKSGNVGFIGGVNVPLIKKFETGYTAGVKSVKPDAEVQVAYLTQPPDFTGFNDPAKGRTAAEGMFDNGADVVYHAAGGSGSGLFQAADAAGKLAIGVDSDQYLSAPEAVRDAILTSMLKKVDVAVFDFISSVQQGNFTAGQKVYDLENNGVDYSKSNDAIQPYVQRLDQLKQQVISGEVEVPGGSTG